MPTILKDQTIQFAILAVISLMAAGVTLLVWFLNRKVKRFGYQIVSVETISSVVPELENRLQFLFDGQSIESLTVTRIALVNTGKVAITRDDFASQLSIEFGENAKVLDWEILDAHNPIAVGFKCENHGSHLCCSPLLFNAGDRIVLRLIVAGKQHTTVTARIHDVKKIERISQSVHGGLLFFSGLSISIAAVAAFRNQFIVAGVMATVSYLVLFALVIQKFSRLSKKRRAEVIKAILNLKFHI